MSEAIIDLLKTKDALAAVLLEQFGHALDRYRDAADYHTRRITHLRRLPDGDEKQSEAAKAHASLAEAYNRVTVTSKDLAEHCRAIGVNPDIFAYLMNEPGWIVGDPDTAQRRIAAVVDAILHQQQAATASLSEQYLDSIPDEYHRIRVHVIDSAPDGSSAPGGFIDLSNAGDLRKYPGRPKDGYKEIMMVSPDGDACFLLYAAVRPRLKCWTEPGAPPDQREYIDEASFCRSLEPAEAVAWFKRENRPVPDQLTKYDTERQDVDTTGWLTAAEAARKAGVSSGTISRECKANPPRIVSQISNGNRLIDPASLDYWIRNKQARDEKRHAVEPVKREPVIPFGECQGCGDIITLKGGKGTCPKCITSTIKLLRSTAQYRAVK